MRTRGPMSTSLSTADPRPITVPSPTRARSRTWHWSPRIAPGPTLAPCTSTAPAQTVAPSPTSAAGGVSRGAVERGPRASGLPTTAASWIRTRSPITVPPWITTLPPISTLSGTRAPSPSSRPGARSDGRSTRGLLKRLLEGLEHPHHSQSRLRPGAGGGPVADALHEVAGLDPEGLLVRDPRAVHVAGPGDVLAVGGEVLVEPLVVHGHLALHGHIVEGGHPLRAHDSQAPLLVGVEPGQVHVGREPRGEAQVAEHHVLDPLAHVALAHGPALGGLLARDPQHHRDVVGPQGPQRVLVRAQLAEVETVGVHVADVAELAGVGKLLELLDSRVVLEQVPHHQHAIRGAGGLHCQLGLVHRLPERLLDEAVLADAEHPGRQLRVRRHGGGHHHGLQLGVAQKLVEVRGHLSAGELRRPALASLARWIADPGQLRLGQPVEVASEVGSPVAEAHDPDPHRTPVTHRRRRLGDSIPRVTPRKSTTRGALSSTSCTSSSGCAVTITAQSASSSASSTDSERRPKSASSGT